MKSSLVACLLLAISHVGLAAPKSSKLSDYAGTYFGTIQLVSGTTTLSGTTTGTIKASKKKENGTIALKSIASGGGTSLTWDETYAILSRALTYTLTSVSSGTTSAGSGKGQAAVGAKSIKYSATFTVADNTYFVSGTVEKAGRKLKISEVITSNSNVISATYNLTKSGKK